MWGDEHQRPWMSEWESIFTALELNIYIFVWFVFDYLMMIPSWNCKLEAKKSWCHGWFNHSIAQDSWNYFQYLPTTCQCFAVFKLFHHLPMMYFQRVGPPSWLTHYFSLKQKKRQLMYTYIVSADFWSGYWELSFLGCTPSR